MTREEFIARAAQAIHKHLLSTEWSELIASAALDAVGAWEMYRILSRCSWGEIEDQGEVDAVLAKAEGK